MNISVADLKKQYAAAIAQWPALTGVEAQHKLPVMLLFAVGSRETNLRNIVAGTGHGIFQLDSGSHTIPIPFPVREQATVAASMLQGLITHYKTWDGKLLTGATQLHCAIAAYNAGTGNVKPANPDEYTAGGDYGVDVLARMNALRELFPSAVSLGS